MSATFPRSPRLETRSQTPSAMWPVLCTALIVGAMLAEDVLRFYSKRRPPLGNRGTGAFGTARSIDEPQPLQRARGAEPGRGRHAEAPWQIPFRGWKDIFWRTYRQIGEDRLLAVAAGVVFYGLLAVFPAVTALVSLYGLFASPTAIADQLALLSGILPDSAVEILREQIGRLTANTSKLGFGFIFGLVIALWSANSGMKAIMDALNVVYEEKEKRGFIKLNLVSLGFTLAGIGVLLLALAAVVILPVTLDFLGLHNAVEQLLRFARWPLLVVVIILGLAMLYRYGPSRREPRWQWISVGSLFAAVAWLVSSALLSWYLTSFAHYDATYGSLGAGIGMMMWMWISSIVILFGAQLNSEIEHQTVRDSTVQGEKPLGARGAIMADSVGKAVK
jgi:membrane protein